MGFQCGIVGLPNVGKSTIFNALTAAGAASENYPFCTIEPNIGRVDVPDERLKKIESFVKTKKIIPAAMEFVDIAGLVRGAASGEGLGNQFLGHIRSTDAIAHVVRCFDDGDITHVDGEVDPRRDVETIETELILADSETVESAIARYAKLNKSPDQRKNAEIAKVMLEALGEHLAAAKLAKTFDLDTYLDDQGYVASVFKQLHLITAKPVLFVGNIDEETMANDGKNKYTEILEKIAEERQARWVTICGKLEAELSDLDDESKQEMMQEMGIHEPGLNSLIREGYKLLGLKTYFTAGETEIRAWTIRDGMNAPQAAGKIHSDFERGFICAEVFTLDDLEKNGSKSKLKESGKLRLEGKEYIVVDGDIMEFRFNV